MWVPAILLICCIFLHLRPAAGHEPRSIRVREGDTLIAIARRYRVPVEALKRRNGLRSNLIRIGQRLRLPAKGQHLLAKGGRRSKARARRSTRKTKKKDGEIGENTPTTQETRAEIRARRRRVGGGERFAAARLLQRRAPQAWRDVVREALHTIRSNSSDSEEISTGTLASPVPNGAISRGFGSGRRGYHLALDIGAKTGTPVKAAEGGVVIYAGRGFRGFGRIVILLHERGWVTGYAHNHRNHVSAGEVVARGERIAEVGASGRAHGPHLHFMFLHNGRYCDAEPLLRPAIANHKSDSKTRRLQWKGKKPSAIRCKARALKRHRKRRRRRPKRKIRRRATLYEPSLSPPGLHTRERRFSPPRLISMLAKPTYPSLGA